MRRIDLQSTSPGSDEARQHAADVVMRGATPEGEVVVISAHNVTFPGVWRDGERVYDVEVWRDGELVATVPPASDEVDASFGEHESRSDL